MVRYDDRRMLKAMGAEDFKDASGWDWVADSEE